jgi:NADH-quinone oxidoreductase subunit L
MMVALGVSKYEGHDGLGYMASMFHLFTHAFFKALLFLGAGSVIHAVYSNDIGQMGGLHKYMKITSWTFLVACLAITGIPPFSGFFSKDEILAAAFHNQPVVFWILWIVAGLTAFYMFRLYFRIFWNKKDGLLSDARNEKHTHSTVHVIASDSEAIHEYKPHESPWTMTIPLIILAVFSSITGFIPFGKFINADNKPFDIHIDGLVAVLSVVVAVIGIGIAFVMYFKDNKLPAKIAQKLGGFYTATLHKFYIDEVWMWFTQTVIFKYICMPIAWFDRHIIDGMMNGLAWTTQKSSDSIKGLQSGQVQFYALVFVAGLILVAVLTLFLIRN